MLYCSEIPLKQRCKMKAYGAATSLLCKILPQTCFFFFCFALFSDWFPSRMAEYSVENTFFSSVVRLFCAQAALFFFYFLPIPFFSLSF